MQDGVFWFYNTPGTLKVIHGLAQVSKGAIEEARQLWQAGLAENPDGRLLRLHLEMPPALLERMARKVTGPATTEDLNSSAR